MAGKEGVTHEPVACGCTQFVTLAVSGGWAAQDVASLQTTLAHLHGVEAVAPDPAAARIWVFGDGRVEPEELVDVLACLGCGACVVEHQVRAPRIPRRW